MRFQKAIAAAGICLMILMVEQAQAKKRYAPQNKDRVLIFFLTKGFKHKSIPAGITAIQKLGEQNNFDVDTTTNPENFNDNELKNYKALIFLSPTGDSFFNEAQKSAFKQFIHAGGGFAGVHAATDCLYEWSWYGQLVGAYFEKHPPIQEAKVLVADKNHLSTRHLTSPWLHTDEWYNFKSFNKSVKVLLQVDEESYKGGDMGSFHPVSWYHLFEGGRVFYTAMGHTDEAFTSDEMFLKHLLGGIKYVLGRKE